MSDQYEKSNHWLEKPLSSILPKWNIYTALILVLLVVAVISRFSDVGLRVMSHDEVNHVTSAWDFFQGRGYQHNPVTHGPLQFHLLAFSFFMFGDSDVSARIPAALFSIAAIAFVLFGYKRYLGKTGALIAGVLFLISPFMLFYGRYTRNEAFIQLFGVVMIYAILRYLDKGDKTSLYLLTLSTVLHFTSKETSFIYAAQALLFAGIVFLDNVVKIKWKNEKQKNFFIIFILLALFLIGLALGFSVWDSNTNPVPEGEALEQTAEIAAAVVEPMTPQKIALYITLGGSLLFGTLAIILLIQSIGFSKVKSLRSFDIIILLGTLVLPQLCAFPIKLLGWNPIDYSNIGLARTGIVIVLLLLLSIFVGLWWNPRVWLVNAGIFYAVFTVFYTTFFTNGQGFFTGMVGSLGYWISQQGVQRGSQPWYYYALIQLPIYEYLALLGAFVALFFGFRKNNSVEIEEEVSYSSAVISNGMDNEVNNSNIELNEPEIESKNLDKLTFTLLLFWFVTSLIAYSIAGEKMPWLTVHISLPLLLLAGWGLGHLIDKINWKNVLGKEGVISVLLMPVLITSLFATFGSILGTNPPFQGKTLEQLQASNKFLLSFITALISGGAVFYLLRAWSKKQVFQLLLMTLFLILSILTVRTSYKASFINYDNAKEFLVYAHAASGPKEVLKQVEEISRRKTKGLDIDVAYDSDALYPYWWYFRNYPNHNWYKDKPTRELRNYSMIIAGETTLNKLDSIVQDNFVEFEYMRLWWPNQDYFDLTWERIKNIITDAPMRSAIFDIWLNRDYTQYQTVTGKTGLSLEDWQPSSKMKFYIRKDLVSELWNYGSAPVIQTVVEEDPYLENMKDLNVKMVIGAAGNTDRQFQSPKGIDVAPDGTIYVADSQNHRIQHFLANGEFINSWGSHADVSVGDAPGGTFYEPWGIEVAPDGSVYVADTWNHRIQKFTSDGKFIKMWGYFGQAESPDAFWGPRDLAIDADGNVYVTDTGNKRIAIFDSDGNYINQFGTVGMEPGEFDEPVGIAIGEQGQLYINDTWNQRIQVFTVDLENDAFIPSTSWDVYAWFGQSLDNKPYIDVSKTGDVFITDPEGYRVLQFDSSGVFIQGWGDYSAGLDGFGLPSGLAVDDEGNLWVSDSENNRLIKLAPDESLP